MHGERDVQATVDAVGAARGRRGIAAALRRAILRGELREGDALASTRVLAGALGCARGTVVQAYDELAGEGFLAVRSGSVTRVAVAVRERAGGPGPHREPHREPPAAEPAWRIDLRPGRPRTTGLDADRSWRSAWRRAGALPVSSDVPDPFGDAALRREVAEHVRRARGVMCTADDVVVTAGTGDAVALVLQARTAALGRALRIGVEDPGFRTTRRVVQLVGARAMGIAVSGAGIDPASLGRADGVIVTPSHQYPLGGALDISRRHDLLAWARERDALIIEDDYDSEFRHGAAPLPAITGLATAGEAVLVGTLSKILSPGLRVAYVIVRDITLRRHMADIRRIVPMPVAQQVQHALALFLEDGGLRRHVARQRRAYAHRREMVIRSAANLPAGLSLSGVDGGLHAVITWAAGHPAGAALRDRLLRAGIATGHLADYRLAPDGSEDDGIVIGYAAPTDLQLLEALTVMGDGAAPMT